ncbi:MAG: polymer-forming cytoskeletal protein, partial [Clostridia bacterium]|nr:polymer-forming cytoskeletal protein [Clostridia bacterium]
MKKSKNRYAIKSICFICLIFFSFIIFKNNVFAEENVDANTNKVEDTKISNIFDIDASANAYKFSEKKPPRGPFIRYMAERVIVDRELSGMGTIISNKTIDVIAPTTGIQVLFGTDTVRINSDMEYAVVFSSTNVIVEGNITKDLIVFSGGKLTIGENAKIAGDVIFYGNNAEIKGTIQGNMIGAVQNLTLAGTIEKDLRVKVSNVELVDGNKVNGNIFFMTYNQNLAVKDTYPNAEVKVYEQKTTILDFNTILAGITTSLLFTLLYLLVEKISKGKTFSKMITK